MKADLVMRLNHVLIKPIWITKTMRKNRSWKMMTCSKEKTKFQKQKIKMIFSSQTNPSKKVEAHQRRRWDPEALAAEFQKVPMNKPRNSLQCHPVKNQRLHMISRKTYRSRTTRKSNKQKTYMGLKPTRTSSTSTTFTARIWIRSSISPSRTKITFIRHMKTRRYIWGTTAGSSKYHLTMSRMPSSLHQIPSIVWSYAIMLSQHQTSKRFRIWKLTAVRQKKGLIKFITSLQEHIWNCSTSKRITLTKSRARFSLAAHRTSTGSCSTISARSLLFHQSSKGMSMITPTRSFHMWKYSRLLRPSNLWKFFQDTKTSRTMMATSIIRSTSITTWTATATIISTWRIRSTYTASSSITKTGSSLATEIQRSTSWSLAQRTRSK